MGEDDGFRDVPSQYAGEDTRLTSRKELAGWYTYAFAAEVFVICGIGMFFYFICDYYEPSTSILELADSLCGKGGELQVQLHRALQHAS